MDQLNIISYMLNIRENDIELLNTSKADNKIYLSLKKKSSFCPYCGSASFLSKGYYSRKLVVPNKPFMNDTIILRIHRFLCPDCNHSFSDNYNMSFRNSKISFSTITEVMNLLKSDKMTFREVSDILKISESSVVRIFDRHCHLPRVTFPEVMCIDEVYTRNSDYDSKYSCVLYDFSRQKIVDIMPSRKKDYLFSYFDNIDSHERDNVRFFCMDMYPTYKFAVKKFFKKATICVDSFHVIKHINDDLSKVRIRVMKQYSSDSIEYYLLKSFNYLLMDRTIDLNNKARYNKRLHYYINYASLLNLILSVNEDLKHAYELKEAYCGFNASASYEYAKEHYDVLLQRFIDSNIDEFEELITLMKNWKSEIINSFILYKGRRINNSVAESVNAKISSIIFNTKGIRNSERRRKRIMYSINKEGFLLK